MRYAIRLQTLFRSRSCPPFALLALHLSFVITNPLGAEDKAKLDDELMESLDSELLEGLETVPANEPAAEEAGDDASAPATSGSDEDAFTRISKRMREAERLIPQARAKTAAKKLQQEIVSDLDQLITELEKQCQKCQGEASSGGKHSQQKAQRQSQKQPGQQKPGDGEHDSKNPASDATEKLGKDEVRKADMEQMKGLLKDLWGQLPAKAREQMLQSSPEQFLPKYELLIEDYYRKLAEKQQASE